MQRQKTKLCRSLCIQVENAGTESADWIFRWKYGDILGYGHVENAGTVPGDLIFSCNIETELNIEYSGRECRVRTREQIFRYRA